MRRSHIVALSLMTSALISPILALAQLEPAEKALRSGDYQLAEQIARPLIHKRNAIGAHASLILGRAQLETGHYAEAIKSANKARAVVKSRAAACELEGEAHLKQGRVREATRAFEEAVKAAGQKGGWRARLLLARAHLRDGNRLAARPILDALADAYNDGSLSETDPEGMAAVASAVVALEYWQDGNETFATATKLDPSRVETQTEWARLFLEKYDPGHAEECIREALKVNPNHAVAHLLMAKIRMTQGFDFVRANEELDAALKTNPNLAEAYAYRATLEVRDRLWEKAHKSLDRALAIDPSNPYALSVRAATYYVADDRRGYEKTLATLRNRDRRSVGHLKVMNELLEWEHRYSEIVELNRAALKADQSYTSAYGVIGMNLMRLGQEDEAIAELRESWNHDRFNVLVYNTLNLYDDVLSKEYNFVKRGSLRYRFHKNDQKVLERYLPGLLERGYREMSQRYGLRPQQTTIEVFANEDHFARRSVGLPHVGVQGICFGKVVVAGGPRAAPVNYGQVLWHELGHVFTIQLSKSRVPRWLTEGISVHEELLGSTSWSRDNDGVFYRWMKAGRMPSVASFNTAFSRARSGSEIALAYYGSAKLVEHIKARHGWPKILQMLRQFGQGKRTNEVVRSVLRLEPEELDRQFRSDVLLKLGLYSKNFQVDYSWYYDLQALKKATQNNSRDASAWGRAAVAAMAHGDKVSAQNFASKAIALEPYQPEARHVLSDLSAITGNFAQAREHAEVLFKQGHDGYGLRLNLAAGAKKSGNVDEAIRQYQAAAKLDPQQLEPHLMLAKIYLDKGIENEGVRALRAAADRTPHDRGLYQELLPRLTQSGQWDLVQQYGERSIWIDPFNPELHLQLAGAYEKNRNNKRALFEYESALLCEPEDLAKVHLAQAQFYERTGKRSLAIKSARAAIQANTKSSHKAQQFLDSIE